VPVRSTSCGVDGQRRPRRVALPRRKSELGTELTFRVRQEVSSEPRNRTHFLCAAGLLGCRGPARPPRYRPSAELRATQNHLVCKVIAIRAGRGPINRSNTRCWPSAANASGNDLACKVILTRREGTMARASRSSRPSAATEASAIRAANGPRFGSPNCDDNPSGPRFGSKIRRGPTARQRCDEGSGASKANTIKVGKRLFGHGHGHGGEATACPPTSAGRFRCRVGRCRLEDG
jgi:hypothetical protein